MGLPEADAVNDTRLLAHAITFAGLPVMTGGLLTATVVLHVLVQLLASAIITLNVNVPAPPVFTLTDWPLLAPEIVPLPLIDQLYALIAAGAV